MINAPEFTATESRQSAIATRARTRYLTLTCLVASLGGLLFGFDTAVISGTLDAVKNQFVLSGIMEGWFTSSALVGCIFGALIAGYLGDRFGRKPILIASGILFLLSGIYSTIPKDFDILTIARLFCGLGVGMSSVIAPMYITEFAPPKLRGRLVAFYQLSIVIGILAATVTNWQILRFAQAHSAETGGSNWIRWLFVDQYWRGMFGAEILPAILFLILLCFVPESPRWLIKMDRSTDGLNILTRISGEAIALREFEDIKQTLNSHETSVRELFRPGLRRALLIGIMLSVFGQLSGVNIVVYYGPKILMAAGFHEAGALLGQVGFGLINLIFTILALLVIDRWGRRPLLIGGMAVVTFALTAIGCLFFFGGSTVPAPMGAAGPAGLSQTASLWIGIMICIYIACIALSICAVIWVLTPEIFPTRVRSQGASIATFANWGTNAVSAFVFPWYVSSFGMHTFFFTTGAICLVATLFFWKEVPETKGRTLEEIEKLWLPSPP
ncbi:MAG: sugar transporter [Verrucomicrobiales bacterium]|jgi:SP family arabinose:H+ symporter-like MFS transporter|nr:sugar transporter [Verrucomicrobiales bacterium]